MRTDSPDDKTLPEYLSCWFISIVQSYFSWRCESWVILQHFSCRFLFVQLNRWRRAKALTKKKIREKTPQRGLILQEDHRSAVSRWQQRARAKRIYLVANAAGILPSDVRKSPPPTALPNWAPTGSLLGCSHAKWLQNERSDIMLSKTRTKSAR